jgi:hypothetical protein
MLRELWSENAKGKDHSEDIGIDGKNISMYQSNRVKRYDVDESASG